MKTRRHERSTYVLYRTNRPNFFGGYNTYSSLYEALDNGEEVYVQQYARDDNKIGVNTNGYLCKLLWETRIK